MRKVGTLSSALGFIFLGVWMIINKVNPGLGNEVFKWWPIIIILLGIEIVIYFNKRAENEPVGFNGWIILVFIIFISMNAYMSLDKRLGEGIRWFRDNNSLDYIVNMFGDIDNERYKAINIEQSFPKSGEKVNLNFDNAEIKLKRAEDNNIRIEGKVYVEKESIVENYDLKGQVGTNETIISLEDKDIKKTELTIYIPAALNVSINGNNLSVKNTDEMIDTKFDVKAGNGNAEFYKVGAVVINFNNGNVNIKDIKDVKLECNNGNIDLSGDVQNIDVKANNGKVEVNNERCGNVNINSNLGVVKFTTKDDNIDVNIDLDKGTASLNNERKINSGISKTFGGGIGKVQIKLNSGTVSVKNK